jgi:CRISPR-associated endonuclease/helicase Cas3
VLSWQTGNRGFARELIRDIHSINIVLIDKDDKISNLFNYESVTMHPFSLKGQLKKILERFDGEVPELAYSLQPSNFLIDEEDEELELTPISIDKMEYESIIALNADYVGYSELTGLDFTDNFGVTSNKIENKKEQNIIKYQYDTFEEHNDWMIQVYQEMYSYQFALSKIKKKYYQEFDFDELIKFMIICHDFGKLNNKWQKIVQKYQSLKSGKEVTELLAHTDFDKENENDVEMMKTLGKKPPHAGIGTRIFEVLFETIYERYAENKYFSSIRNLISTSILRHHSSKTITIPKYSINENIFRKMIETYFDINSNRIVSKYSTSKIELIFDDVIGFQNKIETFVYFIFQRILRLCDQKSFEKNRRR